MINPLGIAGGVIGAYGHKLTARQSARASEANARLAELDAQLSLLSAQVDIEEIERAGAATRATQRATAAGQGSRSDEGSPLALLMEASKSERRAVLRRQYIGDLEVYKFGLEARRHRRAAKSAKMIGYFNAFSSVLGGAASSYGGGYGG